MEEEGAEASDDEEEFRIGQGRAEMQLETPITYFRKYRRWLSETMPILQQAVRVLFIEGSTSLSERHLLGGFAHMSYSDNQREATQRVKNDIASGLIAELRSKSEEFGASPLLSPKAFDNRLKAFTQHYRRVVAAILHAGIFSDRFGVDFYDTRKALREVYYGYLLHYFEPLVSKMLMARLVRQSDLWYIFSLKRRTQIYEERVFGVTTVPTLQAQILRSLPFPAFSVVPFDLTRIFRSYFNADIQTDPNDTQYILCWSRD